MIVRLSCDGLMVQPSGLLLLLLALAGSSGLASGALPERIQHRIQQRTGADPNRGQSLLPGGRDELSVAAVPQRLTAMQDANPGSSDSDAQSGAGSSDSTSTDNTAAESNPGSGTSTTSNDQAQPVSETGDISADYDANGNAYQTPDTSGDFMGNSSENNTRTPEELEADRQANGGNGTHALFGNLGFDISNRSPYMTDEENEEFNKLTKEYADFVLSYQTSTDGVRPQFEDFSTRLKQKFEWYRNMLMLGNEEKWGVEATEEGYCPGEPKCTAHGVCRDICYCFSGWGGDDCAELLLACPFDCSPRGYATGKCVGEDKCECSSGYSGVYCEKVDCPGSCGGADKGICDHTTGECSCVPGRKGADCGDTFCHNNCETSSPYLPLTWKHGSCEDRKCVCDPGWTGADCSKHTCESDIACLNGGTCEDGECVCLDDYEDADCSRLRCLGDCNDVGICNYYGQCRCGPGTAGEDCGIQCVGNFTSVQQTYHAVGDHVGFIQLEQHGLLPPSATAQLAVSYFGKIYLYGGWTKTDHSSMVLHEDIWTYTHTSKEFSKLVLKGTTPPPRGFAGGDVIGAKMFVYGGTPEPHPLTTIVTPLDKVVYGDMWVYDFNARAWTAIGQEGEVPPGIYGHTMTKISPTQLALFGGVGQEGNIFNHLYVYDITTNVFKNMSDVTWRNYKYMRDAYESIHESSYVPDIPIPAPNTVDATFLFSNEYTGTDWAEENEPSLIDCVANLTNLTYYGVLLTRCYSGDVNFTTTECQFALEVPSAQQGSNVTSDTITSNLTAAGDILPDCLSSKGVDVEEVTVIYLSTIANGNSTGNEMSTTDEDKEASTSFLEVGSTMGLTAPDFGEGNDPPGWASQGRGTWAGPSWRIKHTAVVYNEKLYIYGGLGFQAKHQDYCDSIPSTAKSWTGWGWEGESCSDPDEKCNVPEALHDFWKFDFKSNNWTAVDSNTLSVDHAPKWYESRWGGNDRCDPNDDGDIYYPGMHEVYGIPESQSYPPARFGHAMVLTGSKSLVFGGTDGNNKILDDMWEFDFDQQQWSLIPSIDIQAFPASIEPPPICLMAAQWVIDEWVFVFGTAFRIEPISGPPFFEQEFQGLYVDFEALHQITDVFTYKPATNFWANIPYVGWQPSARSFPKMLAMGGNYLWLHGGRGTENGMKYTYDEMWKFSPDEQYWSYQYVNSPTEPPARSQHVMLKYTETLILIFGGHDGVAALNDVWTFEISEGLWQQYVASGESASPRSLAAATLVVSDALPHLLVYGGMSGSTSLDDMWLFDPILKTWTLVEITGVVPDGRAGFASTSEIMEFDMFDGYLLVGEVEEGGQIKDVSEIWHFDVTTSAWSQVEVVVEESEPPLPRHWHSTASVEGLATFMFGGTDGSQNFDDVYWYMNTKRSWNKYDPGFDLHPSKRYGAALSELCANIFMFGGEKPGFPMRDMWVFMVDSSILRSPAMFPFVEDQPASTLGGDTMRVDPGLLTSSFTDPIIEWEWYSDAKKLKDGSLFENVPKLEEKSEVLVKNKPGYAENADSLSATAVPYLLNTTTSELVIQPTTIMPKVHLKCIAKSELGFRMTSNKFYAFTVEAPLMEDLLDVDVYHADGRDPPVMTAHVVAGVHGDLVEVTWWHAANNSQVVEADGMYKVLTNGGGPPYKLKILRPTIGSYHFYIKARCLMTNATVESNIATVYVMDAADEEPATDDSGCQIIKGCAPGQTKCLSVPPWKTCGQCRLKYFYTASHTCELCEPLPNCLSSGCDGCATCGQFCAQCAPGAYTSASGCIACLNGEENYNCPSGAYKSGAACDGFSNNDTQSCKTCINGGDTGIYDCPIGTYADGQACNGDGVVDSQICPQCSNGGASYVCSAGFYRTGVACDGTGTENTQTCEKCDNGGLDYKCESGQFLSGTMCDGTSTSDTQTCGNCTKLNDCAGYTSCTDTNVDLVCSECAVGYMRADGATCTACSHMIDGGYACASGYYKNGTECPGGIGMLDTQACKKCDNGQPYMCALGEFKTGTECDGTGDSDTQTCSTCGAGGINFLCPVNHHRGGVLCTGMGSADTQECVECWNTYPNGYQCEAGDFKNGLTCNGKEPHDTQTCASCVELENCAGVTTCTTGPEVFRACDLCDPGFFYDPQMYMCAPAKCPVNSIGVDVSSGCLCNGGYHGVVQTSDLSPYFISSCTKCALGFYAPFGCFDPDNPVPCERACEVCAGGTFASVEGSSQCTKCEEGTYQANTAKSSCMECQVGTYGDSSGSSACTACPRGMYQPEIGKTSCIECAPGSIQPATGGTRCNLCPSGMYDAVDRILCSNCSADSTTDGMGGMFATDCKCNAGYAGSHDACAACAPGTYTTKPGLAGCLACGYGKYSDDSNSDSCKDCPEHSTTTTPGAAALSDCACDTGYDYDASTASCVLTLCGVDERVEANACVACPVGKVSTAGGHDTSGDDTACDTVLCGVNRHVFANVCIDCPTGTAKAAGGDASGADTTCSTAAATGIVLVQTGTTTCAVNEKVYGNACVACPAGKISAGGDDPIGDDTSCTAIECAANERVHKHTCVSCSAGRYADAGADATLDAGTVCLQCAKGKYRDGSDPAGDCLECPTETTTLKSGSIAQMDCKCKPGYVGMGGSDCQPCAEGTYSPMLGQLVCLACKIGMYQDKTGQSACMICSNGYADALGMSECTICATCDVSLGLTSAMDCRESADTVCHCAAGYYGDPSQCLQCDTGTYQDIPGQQLCKEVPLGTYQDSPGEFKAKVCNVSLYQDQTGQVACVACPIGAGHSMTKQTSVESCQCVAGTSGFALLGQNCVDCPPGYYKDFDGDSADCQICPPGTYQPIAAQSACLPCPANGHHFKSGSTSLADCQCMPGTEGAASVGLDCTECAPGKHKQELKDAYCEECDAGWYQSYPKQHFCLQCEPGTYTYEEGQSECSACTPGRYNNVHQGTMCEPCLKGQSNLKAGQTECQNCAVTTYQEWEAQETCLGCGVGTYQDETYQSECKSCQGGTYQNEERQSECKACNQGYFEYRTGSSECLGCQGGKFQEEVGQRSCKGCFKGYYSVDGTGKASCDKCTPGHYSVLPSQSACIPCALGEYQQREGRGKCNICERGTYANETGHVECKACPKGKIGLYLGQTECEDCHLGKYTSSEGKTQCKDCKIGTYGTELGFCGECDCGHFEDGEGKTECKVCAAGYYAKNGSDACTICGIGRYGGGADACECDVCGAGTASNNLEGQTECTDCKPGTYSASKASPVCSACAAGKYSRLDFPMLPIASGYTECADCFQGRYQSDTGQTECMDPCNDATSHSLILDEKPVSTDNVTGMCLIKCVDGDGVVGHTCEQCCGYAGMVVDKSWGDGCFDTATYSTTPTCGVISNTNAGLERACGCIKQASILAHESASVAVHNRVAARLKMIQQKTEGGQRESVTSRLKAIQKEAAMGHISKAAAVEHKQEAGEGEAWRAAKMMAQESPLTPEAVVGGSERNTKLDTKVEIQDIRAKMAQKRKANNQKPPANAALRKLLPKLIKVYR